MKALFNEATETNLATALIDQMALAWLTDRMTGGNLEAALEVFERPGTREAAKTEFDALSDEERRELVGAIMPDINEAVSEAIKRLWHACYRLGFDPEDLDPEHVVLVAMTLIGASGVTRGRVMTSLLTFPSNGTLVEVTLTDEQAGDITHSRPVTWTSPELPDSGIDEDGTIITAEDARPIL